MTVLRRVALLSLAILYVAVDPSFADSTFTDDMFNLANYSVTIFKSNPGATITNQQTLTGGNTGGWPTNTLQRAGRPQLPLYDRFHEHNFRLRSLLTGRYNE